MKRKFKFTVLLFKNRQLYMEFIFNTVNPMFFSQAYNLLYDKLRYEFPPMLGYEYTVSSVSSEPYIELDLL